MQGQFQFCLQAPESCSISTGSKDECKRWAPAFFAQISNERFRRVLKLNAVPHLSIWKWKQRQSFVGCLRQLPPPKPCYNFRFCSYHMHFNRPWLNGMTALRSKTSNWNTLISWHLKHTNLHFEWGYLQQNRHYLLAFSSTSRGSVTYPLIANDLPNKHAGSSNPRGNTTSHRKDGCNTSGFSFPGPNFTENLTYQFFKVTHTEFKSSWAIMQWSVLQG